MKPLLTILLPLGIIWTWIPDDIELVPFLIGLFCLLGLQTLAMTDLKQQDNRKASL